MKKVVVSGLIIILIGLVGAIASFAMKNPFQTLNINKKETINSNGINNIDITSSSTDVYVTSSKKKDITVELTGKMSKNIKEDYKLNVEKNNGTLTIHLKRKNTINISLMNFSHTKLIVSIPEGSYQSMSVVTSSGDIVAKRLNAVQLGVKSSSGDIHLEDGTASERSSFESSSGDVNVDGLNSKQTSASSSSGSIKLSDITGDVNAESSSGDIGIHPSEKIAAIYAETSSGDVQVQTDQKAIPFSINYKGQSGEGSVKLDGVQYSVKSEHVIVGKVSTGTIKLKVRTSSGDFTLK